MKFPMKDTIPPVIVASLCIPIESRAYLGGFEPNDGYQAFVFWVNGYNAGQYGSANGGTVGSLVSGLNPPAADFVGGLWNDKNDAFSTYNVMISPQAQIRFSAYSMEYSYLPLSIEKFLASLPKYWFSLSR